MTKFPEVPEGYHSVQPYLMFKDAAAAMAFYIKAFGATQRLCMKGPDGRVGHAEMVIGDSVIMMADENAAIGAYSVEHFGGSPAALMMHTADCDATYKEALAAGAVSEREPADQPYGERMCGVRDPFGYRWYVATHLFHLSKEELKKL
jgi:PhnB protein